MKTTFYKLRQPSEAKVIGVKDGGSQAEFLRDGFINKNHYDEIIQFTSLKNQSNFGNFPSFEINLEYVKMRTDAKLTDFISFHPSIPFAEYLISDKVVRILSTFKIPEYKLYKVTIDYNGKIIKDYHLFFCPPFDFNVINYSKSLFYSGNSLLGKKFYSFNNFNEYHSFAKENLIRAEKICLNDNSINKFDYLDIRHSPEPFVSEDLKETFEIAGVTGINFVDTTEPELIFEE